MSTGSFQTCHCGGAMRKLANSFLRRRERGREGGGGRLHGITSRPASALGKAWGPGCASVFFPLTRLHMCAVIRFPAASPQLRASHSIQQRLNHTNRFLILISRGGKSLSVFVFERRRVHLQHFHPKEQDPESTSVRWREAHIWVECELRNGLCLLETT